MVGGSLWVLQLFPPLKLVAESGIKHTKSNQSMCVGEFNKFFIKGSN
jgi:hypothetical protein